VEAQAQAQGQAKGQVWVHFAALLPPLEGLWFMVLRGGDWIHLPQAALEHMPGNRTFADLWASTLLTSPAILAGAWACSERVQGGGARAFPRPHPQRQQQQRQRWPEAAVKRPDLGLHQLGLWRIRLRHLPRHKQRARLESFLSRRLFPELQLHHLRPLCWRPLLPLDPRALPRRVT
jgi:hypothetical protein